MTSEPPPLVPDEAQLKEPPPLAAKANDLEALRTAVVDAASVGAGLWVSYLFVLFYMLVAAGGITHKDMFFESPVRLPFLNVDLPLTGFFWLGPGLFLIVHAYVLLHFVMLAGKVSAFESELRDQIDNVEVRRRLRRQLPSNIFVQFLAGPPEVRDGVVGVLLWLIALISLVLAPVALLVFFELQFLPYHHEWITWWQRLAVGIDLLLMWLFWPAIALRQGAEQEPARRRPVAVIQRVGTIGSMYAISVASVVLVGVVATFPGERLEMVQQRVNPTFAQEALVAVREVLVAGKVDTARRKPESLWSNRLVLPGLDVIDRTKLDSEPKIAAASETASLRARNLEGAVLIGAGLRKVDFTGANLRGAFLDKADLRDAKLDCALPFHEGPVRIRGWVSAERAQDNREPVICVQLKGASLNDAQLQGASLNGAQLQGASLNDAQLQGASLEGTQLQGASLEGTQLQGASLNDSQLQGASFNVVKVHRAVKDRSIDSDVWTPVTAQFQGASLNGAQLQGASLDGAQLQGASLNDAQLQGASLNNAQFQGASLIDTQLQGASLNNAQLQGASLNNAQLQGASFDCAQLQGASLSGAFVWHLNLKNSNLTNVQNTGTESHQVVSCNKNENMNGICDWTPQKFRELKDKINHETPQGPGRDLALRQIDQQLDPDKPFLESTQICNSPSPSADEAPSPRTYEAEVAKQWQQAGCASEGSPYVVSRLITRMTSEIPFAATQLAAAFLAETCKGARGLSKREIALLQSLSDRRPPPQSP